MSRNALDSAASAFLALPFSKAAAQALTQTNALVARLRQMPRELMTEELVDDRAALLDKHLPNLLAAHKLAKAAGASSADVDLVAALEHVCEEAHRIIGVCQARAKNDLDTQGRFLESLYPVSDEGPLVSLKEETDGHRMEATSPKSTVVSAQTLDHLLPMVSDRRSTGHPTIDKAPALDWRSLKDVIKPADIFPIAFSIGILCILAMIIGGRVLYEQSYVETNKAFQSQLNVRASITSLHRNIEKYDDGEKHQVATISFNGDVANLTSVEADSVVLNVSIYSCTERNKDRCVVLIDHDYDVTNDTRVLGGLNTHFSKDWSFDIPNVDGTLRAKIRFKGARASNNRLSWTG